MENDTNIEGKDNKIPLTRTSAIQAIQSGDSATRKRAFDLLMAAYWKPVYKYIRIKWNKSNEDAKDLTQGFFTKVREKDFFGSFDPARVRFRTFLRVCLDGYIRNEMKSDGQRKRGGEFDKLSLDFSQAENELLQSSPVETQSPDGIEKYFDSEWTKSLLALSIDALREHCEKEGKSIHFQLLKLYDLEPLETDEELSYDRLAKQFNISVTDVASYLAHARKEFRKIVLINLRELTATDEEFQQEVLQLLGISTG
jgi:RNA polymerase sigma factor (sigma-70 family)